MTNHLVLATVLVLVAVAVAVGLALAAVWCVLSIVLSLVEIGVSQPWPTT